MTEEFDDVTVDPGDIDVFAETMTDLADYWFKKDGGPYKLADAKTSDSEYPAMGEFSEADQFMQAHHGKWTAMATAFSQLNALLEGLHEGSKKVAETYRNVEALNSADADALDSLVDPEIQEQMQDVPQQQGPEGQPQDDGQGNQPAS